MPSVFTKVISGELPGRFVHTDEIAVAFLSIAPLNPGHTLVVPREEIDEWTDASPELVNHCMGIAHRIGSAVKRAFGAPRAAVVIAGFEVPHLHIHVFPAWTLEDFNFARAVPAAGPDLDQAAGRLRAALAAG